MMHGFLGFRLPCGCRMDAEQRQLCGLHAIQYQADQDRADRAFKALVAACGEAEPSHGAEAGTVAAPSRFFEPAWSPYP